MPGTTEANLAKDGGQIPPFEDHARSVILQMRGALAEMLNSVGADPTRSQDIARRFGLNKNLTWKISKIVQETEPGSIIPHIPGRAGMRIFIDAFKEAGASLPMVETVRNAVDDFEQMVKIHSGNRTTLSSMLSGLSDNGDYQQQAEASRKLAFQGNCATWGVQARTQINSTFVAPSQDDPEAVDLAMLNGFLDFRRLRADIPWTIAARRTTYDDGTPKKTAGIQPLEPPLPDQPDVPLFHSFCSRPLPRLRAVKGHDHVLYHQLEEGPVGNTAAVDCVLAGTVQGGLPRYRAEKNDHHQFFSSPTTPAQTLIMDVFVHRDTGCNLVPELGIFSNMPGAPAFPEQGFNSGRLHLGERLVSLGSGPPVVVTSEIPKYTQMVKTILERVGWDIRDFSGHRTIIHYPPIPSMVVFRYDLADPPRL